RLTPPPNTILIGWQGTAGSTLTEKPLSIPLDGTARLGQGAPDSHYASGGSAGHGYPRGRSAVTRRRPRASRVGSPSTPGSATRPCRGTCLSNRQKVSRSGVGRRMVRRHHRTV